MKLERQEAVLVREPIDYDDAGKIRVRFSHPSIGAPTIVLAYQRWAEMGFPAQVKVTIEPVDRKPAF